MQDHARRLSFTVLLAALAALPPLSIDMGLPAFQSLEKDLGTDTTGAGLTLSAFMGGFSVAQLLLGPLSDRIGRRPVLLGGLALYALAGIACATAGGIGPLIALRAVQGACAASGTVMALAVVRDLFDGAAARQKLSYVAVVLSLAPILAPILGATALAVGGWRAVYGFLGAAGLVLWVIVGMLLPETRVPSLRPPHLLAGFLRMLLHRRAMSSAVVNALSFGALFAFISGSSPLLMGNFGLPARLYGLLFAVTAVGIMVGAWLNGRLSTCAISPDRPLFAALFGGLACCLGVLVLIVGRHVTLAALMPLFVGHSFTRGIVAPNATAAALEPMGDIAGLAASVVGCLQMSLAAAASAAVAALYPLLGPPAMALVMSACSAAALATFCLAGERLPYPAATVGGE
jgi:MFS transporter, DHA1 family, multidrug resistance protein